MGTHDKFDFLQTTSPFHEYYEGRIRYFENILTPTTTAVVATATKTKTKKHPRHSGVQSTVTASSTTTVVATSVFENNNYSNNKWKNWKNDGDSTNNKRMKV